MKNKILLYMLSALLFMVTITPYLQAGATEMPAMTEEEILEWQKNVETEINSFVSTLPEDQQQQFHQDVAELTEMMEKMSEEELAEFVQNIFAAEEEQPETSIEPQETVKAAEEITPIVQEPAEDTDKALKIINNIITRTERFLRTAQRIPDLTGKIDQWVAKDKVKEWQVDLTWDTLKGKIESLDQKIIQLKETDPVTKKYRYLQSLIKKETLYNNLTKLSESLTVAEQPIKAPEMGLGQVSKESRAGIQDVLSSFAEAIYTLDLEKEIDKVLAEFAPRAKQLKDEEEAARKKAHDESKKVRRESARKEVGGKQGSYDYGTEYQPSTDYSYPSSYNQGGYNYGDYGTSGQKHEPTEREKPESKEGAKEKEAKKEPKEAKEVKRSDELKKTLELIENALTAIEDVIIDSGEDNIKQYIQHVSDTKNQPSDTRSADSIKVATSDLRKAKRKLASIANKNEQEDVKKRVEKEKEFTAVENEMRSKSVFDNSPQVLKELKHLGDAISSLKYEGFTPTPIGKAPVAPAAKEPEAAARTTAEIATQTEETVPQPTTAEINTQTDPDLAAE